MKKLFIILPVLMLSFASCTERLDIKLDETYTRLVVYGTLTTDTARHYVELSKTTSYYYNQPAPPVSGATVEISDDAGNKELLSEVAPGKYATSGDFAAVAGRTYTLQVNLQEEINGHKNYTASSMCNPIYEIDSIGLRPQPDWGEKGFYEVTCYYQDPPTRDIYMFNIFINGELVTDTIKNRIVTDDEFYNGSYTNGIGVGYLDQAKPREVLYTGDTVTFQGCNITEEYYDFILALQAETNFQTPLFSGPPANVKGNVNNGAVGFFAAFGVSYSSLIFKE